jgi:hypothetical protein
MAVSVTSTSRCSPGRPVDLSAELTNSAKSAAQANDHEHAGRDSDQRAADDGEAPGRQQ